MTLVYILFLLTSRRPQILISAPLHSKFIKSLILAISLWILTIWRDRIQLWRPWHVAENILLIFHFYCLQWVCINLDTNFVAFIKKLSVERALLLEFVWVDLPPKAHPMNIKIEVVCLKGGILPSRKIIWRQVQSQVLLHII